MKRIFYFFLSIFLALIIFSSGFFVGKFRCKRVAPENLDFSLFWEAYYKIKENFFEKKKITNENLIYGAISGFVQSLNDPYTIFLPPEETKKFIEDVSGIFEGIGAEIGIKNNQLQIIAPLEGTPAQKAGLKSKDKILEINGKLTEGMSIEEAVRLIRGPKGTKVKLKIFREGWKEPKEIEIQREQIEVPSLKWEIKEDNIIYIKIFHFPEKGIKDFNKVALEILNFPSKEKKIILDLRNNPGGYLEVAINIAGWFLKKNEVVLVEDFGEGKQISYKSEGPSLFSDYPMVVLINSGTASGAEILAAALKENRQIPLIGEPTFGKGTVQRLELLSDGSSIKITVAKWLTPKRNEIHEKGITPDIQIKNPDEEKDLQLEKALEILRNL